MNINLNDFTPALCEPSLEKIYKDFPGWQEELLSVENVHITDFYGNHTTLSVIGHPRIDTNFDGLGVIRCDLDRDIRKRTCKYLFPNLEEVIEKWLGATKVKENAKAKIKYTVHFPALKSHSKEIGLISNVLTKIYTADNPFEPIDIVKDISKEHVRSLMRKYTAYLDLMSTQTKPIMARPYRKEDK